MLYELGVNIKQSHGSHRCARSIHKLIFAKTIRAKVIPAESH
jgi:hypothetical protein